MARARTFQVLLIGATCDTVGRSLFDCRSKRTKAVLEAMLADLKSGRRDRVDTVEQKQDGPKRYTYTALRDADGIYRGVLQTTVPMDEPHPDTEP